MENGNGTIKKSHNINYSYGCFGFYSTCLQKLNNISFVVLFICISHCSQGALNGLFGVSLSTLEKRFDFSSSQSSWIASAYEIGQIPAVIFVSCFGNSLHRPKCIAIGLVLVSIGGIIFFIPYFTSPLYYLSLGRSLNTSFEKQLCQLDTLNSATTSICASDMDANSLVGYLPMLVIARLLIGIGATPTLSLAVTYINDMCTKEKFSTYAGLYNSMGIVGPAVGIIFGGFMLSLFVDFYMIDPNEIGLNKSHPNWLGNWWMPYIILSFVALLASIPMFGYPNDLPGAAEIRRNKVVESRDDHPQVEDAKKKKVPTATLR